MLRRFVPAIVLAGISTLVLFTVFLSGSWRRIPQSFGLGEKVGPTEEEKANAWPDLRLSRPEGVASLYPNGRFKGDPEVGEGVFKEPKLESHSPYPVGQTKPAGSNYTRALIVPRLRGQKSEWISAELGDMIDEGLLTPYVYVMNDPHAQFHPPVNKGHEVMAYLTYIIDQYEDLRDVNIFMHFHREAWHNNLLFPESPLMVRYLNPERVAREGYMNLRCHWDPGCPAWVHPGATVRDPEKTEEWIIAESWSELFPLDPVPTVLAQPCCAQFAVSRERILAVPRQRYVSMRDWVVRTSLSDYVSGRVFEYIWQYIFTASPLHCPSMSACYCDGYGFCFGDPQAFDHWFELNYLHGEYAEELRVWQEAADAIEAVRESRGGRFGGGEDLSIPEPGRGQWLRGEVGRLWEEMMRLRDEAQVRGRDPRQRAVESGRVWREGDGF
ncbi:hypothetical protein EJ03DRAFT_361628 [Teratosphaeria nubilosa]|uniref:Uncharacterized protein n=1 Tax=Teratosphaeria nubilosa TaxID=161662 RepID=A0A6G1LAX9_9PEZI|nr:hypothetical protein EJ03DRAFT_361628 [Teratosphaeria nubilosa]